MRSTFVGLAVVVVVSAFAAPVVADSQAAKVWRVGFLAAGVSDSRSPGLVAFRQRLRELGYVEGQNVALEVRSAPGSPELLAGLAAELVRLNMDVIVASGRGTQEAAQKATSTIPIVMVIASDPIAAGLVTSLARPGGNVTGLTVQYQDVAGKRLQLLKEVVPNLSRVTVLAEPNPMSAGSPVLAEAGPAGALALQLRAVEVRSLAEYESAFAAASRDRVGAVVVGGPLAFRHRAQIAGFALKRRLPTVGPSADYSEAGFLIGYGPSYTDHGRRAADYVARILKGAKPADLPVEQPTKFHLAVNLKTAKGLGLSIPRPLLQLADQVIE